MAVVLTKLVNYHRSYLWGVHVARELHACVNREYNNVRSRIPNNNSEELDRYKQIIELAISSELHASLDSPAVGNQEISVDDCVDEEEEIKFMRSVITICIAK